MKISSFFLIALIFHLTQSKESKEENTLFTNELILKLLNETLSSYRVSDECTTDFQNALNSNFSSKLIDSWGKPSSGIYDSFPSVLFIGDYHECISIRDPLWSGKYCVIGKPAYLKPRDGLFYTGFRMGVCVPKRCNNKDIAEIMNNRLIIILIKQFGLLTDLYETDVSCQEPKSLDTAAIVSIVVLSVIFAIVLMGTCYDITKIAINSIKNDVLPNSLIAKDFLKLSLKSKQSSVEPIKLKELVDDEPNEKTKIVPKQIKKKETFLEKFLINFSFYSNTIKLFKINSEPGQTDCINAIRVLSTGYVIFSHLVSYSVYHIDNLDSFTKWLKRPSFELVNAGFFSVDSFFLMSGLLTSYLFLKELDGKKMSRKSLSFFMIKYYIHRYWRITPPFMLALMISANLSKYFGDGPYFPAGGFEPESCSTTWYKNLLYVHNFFDLNSTAGQRMCFGESWYLADDMQFYWIAPIMLLPLVVFKSNFFVGPIISLFIQAVILIINIVATALIIKTNPDAEITGSPSNFENVYFSPWCRIGPYVIGIFVGYMLHLTNKHKWKKLRFEINLFLWIVSLALIGLMIFGLHRKEGQEPLSRNSLILYQSTSRVIWAAALGYIIYACSTAQGGVFNTIFCWRIWIPLSRLSFSAYLVHLNIQLTYFYNQDKLYHIQEMNFSFLYISMMVVSFIVAYFFSMILEIPLINLDKFVFKK